MVLFDKASIDPTEDLARRWKCNLISQLMVYQNAFTPDELAELDMGILCKLLAMLQKRRKGKRYVPDIPDFDTWVM